MGLDRTVGMPRLLFFVHSSPHARPFSLGVPQETPPSSMQRGQEEPHRTLHGGTPRVREHPSPTQEKQPGQAARAPTPGH